CQSVRRLQRGAYAPPVVLVLVLEMNPHQPRDPVGLPTYQTAKPVVFDHEKLDVYSLLLQFITWVTPLIEDAKATAPAKTREVRDQLDRASLSALLNTAEGNARRQGQVRARGSATEC